MVIFKHTQKQSEKNNERLPVHIIQLQPLSYVDFCLSEVSDLYIVQSCSFLPWLLPIFVVVFREKLDKYSVIFLSRFAFLNICCEVRLLTGFSPRYPVSPGLFIASSILFSLVCEASLI